MGSTWGGWGGADSPWRTIVRKADWETPPGNAALGQEGRAGLCLASRAPALPTRGLPSLASSFPALQPELDVNSGWDPQQGPRAPRVQALLGAS